MKKHLQRLLTNKGVTLLLPIAVLGCAAPAAYNANTGQVAVRPASTTLIQQGEAAFAQYKSKTPVSQNSKARVRAYRVANKLRPVINLPGARWEFEVFEDSSVNAFALPGGKVGINTGLLNIAVTDGQLAAALAHEMAHVTSNHAQARIQNNQMITLGSALLGAVLGGWWADSSWRRLLKKGGRLRLASLFQEPRSWKQTGLEQSSWRGPGMILRKQLRSGREWELRAVRPLLNF